MPMDTRHHRATELIASAQALFLAAGCEAEKATSMARISSTPISWAIPPMVLPRFREIRGDRGRADGEGAGEPRLIADHGARRSLGWRDAVGTATDKALALSLPNGPPPWPRPRSLSARSDQHRLPRGLSALGDGAEFDGDRRSSDPSEATMAPFGGIAAVFTPDPIAFGIPTDGDPILVDISSSIARPTG